MIRQLNAAEIIHISAISYLHRQRYPTPPEHKSAPPTAKTSPQTLPNSLSYNFPCRPSDIRRVRQSNAAEITQIHQSPISIENASTRHLQSIKLSPDDITSPETLPNSLSYNSSRRRRDTAVSASQTPRKSSIIHQSPIYSNNATARHLQSINQLPRRHNIVSNTTKQSILQLT